MLALAVASLQAAGLNDFVISVGQIDFINGLIEAAEVTELQAQELKRCLIEHDVVRLEALADGSRMSPEQKDLFKELPFLHGGLELLDKVEACGLNNKSSKAVQDLREIYALAEVYGAAGYLRFDLGLLRDLDYYTGMLFEGYAEDMGFPIIGGGRYDTMMEIWQILPGNRICYRDRQDHVDSESAPAAGQYQQLGCSGGLAGRLSATGDRAVYASAQERQNSEAGCRAF